MEEAHYRALLRLAYLDLPPRRLLGLLEHFEHPEAIFESSRHELLRVDGMTESAAARILNAPDLPENLWQKCTQGDIRLLTWRDDDYPTALKEIEDFPPLLFVRGSLQEHDRFAVAIVGTRKPTSYGRNVAERLARELSRYGLTVVSGGARGIDTAAHTGALRAGGRTLAVLGCGVDIAYPPESAPLFNCIATQGALLSEYPPGIQPDAWRFPVRNRLVSALVLGVLVVEAPNDSGALITATYALEQGKPVFAVPGNIDTGQSAGCHRLIKEGAVLVDSVEDIVRTLGIAPEPPPERPAPLPELTLTQQEVLRALSLTPKHVDALAEELKLPVAQLNAELLMLEMHHLVRRQPGNTYIRVP
ncbi:MAG: DNA-protecting protein DprA [Armatimonadota bacterium]